MLVQEAGDFSAQRNDLSSIAYVAGRIEKFTLEFLWQCVPLQNHRSAEASQHSFFLGNGVGQSGVERRMDNFFLIFLKPLFIVCQGIETSLKLKKFVPLLKRTGFFGEAAIRSGSLAKLPGGGHEDL